MDFVLDLRNLQQVASFVGSLPEDTEFGEWSFSQLLIHLWTWDEEMMRLLDAQMEGMIKNLRYEDLSEEDKGDMDGFFQFEYQQLGISFEAWNEMMFSRYEDLSTTQLRTNFLLGRKRLFVTYQRHITHFHDQQDITDQTIGLWKHDIHHLKASGYTRDQILEY
ncbi:MAG: hypothetical protein ACXAE3_15155 [Candidatus Kariarchaeaceae archaeon]|jgi:hypothetical protein